MRINATQLNNALVKAKKPEREGEVHFLAIYDRLVVLNKKSYKEMETENIQKIKLVAIVFCKGKNNCWLEWEIEI